jgi:hemerythrin
VKKVKDFKEGFDDGRMMLSIEIIDFMKDWLLNHIQGSDKKYSALFNEKGLS